MSTGVSSLIQKFGGGKSGTQGDEMNAEILKQVGELTALLKASEISNESSQRDTLGSLKSIFDRLGSLESKVGSLQPSASSAGGSGSASSGSSAAAETPLSISAFDAYCASFLDPFVSCSTKLGGDAAAAGNLVKDAWLEMRAFLVMASSCKPPPDAELPGLFSKMSPKVKAIQSAVQRNTWENHTKTCSEGASALNWLLIKPAPRDFIQSGLEGAEYWANRIRKEFRGINQDQITFCDSFKALLSELMAYVKEFHTTGVTWNPKGVTVAEYSPCAGTAPLVAVAAAAPLVQESSKSTTAPAAAAPPKADLFAALNKGGDITSGLKSVTKDMQTWRAEYKGGDAPAPKAVVAPKAAPAAAGPKGTPKLEFQSVSSKWLVENQGPGHHKVAVQGIKESVYIFGCVGATIEVIGKCNGIVVDGCKKTYVYFDNVMASCEIVNSQRMHIECRGKCSAVAIDKTDGIIVKLPKESMDTEIICSKSSEMNLQWEDDAGELVERPIPEQYVHRIKNGAITANVSDLYN